MLRVASIRKTCPACPAQWEGCTENGQFVYIRYRWGYLSISVGPNACKAVTGDVIFQWDGNDGWDGFMDYEQLRDITKDALRLPATDNEVEET